jgi:hypothetical protein
MPAAATLFFRSRFRTKRFREAVPSCMGGTLRFPSPVMTIFAAATGILRVKDCWTLLAADRVERRDMGRTAGR